MARLQERPVPPVEKTHDAKRSRSRDLLEVANRLHDAAASYCAQGKHLKARPLCLRSLRILESTLGPKHPDVANVLHTLAGTYEPPEQAEELYLRSLSIAEAAVRSVDVDTLHIQVAGSVADLYRRQGRFQEAKPLYQRALVLAEQTLGRHHSYIASILNKQALLDRSERRYRDAAVRYQRALAIARRAWGASHPQVAAAYYNLGALEHERGRHAAAEPFVRRALKLRDRALAPDHPDLAANLALLAATLAGQKKYPEAESLYRRAIDVAEQAYGRNHLQVATTLNDLAAMYHAQGDASKPERLYKRVLAIKEKHLGPGHPDVATTLNNLGVFYKALERFAEARPLYERVLAIFEKNLGAAHPNVVTALVNYARLLQAEAAAAEKRAKRIQADLKTTSTQTAKRKIDARVARFRLAVRPSRIHRWGVFAQETIPAAAEVIEYTGKRISRREAKRLAGRKLHYIFHLDNYWVIDGQVGGSGAQYVNHCCNPNVEVRRIDGRILYFSKRQIEAGEELFLDYRFPKSGARVPCRCGAANCRG